MTLQTSIRRGSSDPAGGHSWIRSDRIARIWLTTFKGLVTTKKYFRTAFSRLPAFVRQCLSEHKPY